MNKLGVVCGILSPLLAGVGCGAQEPPEQEVADGDFLGIEEAAQGLSNLSSQCTYSGGVATLALATGDVAMVGKLPSGALGVNGYPCDTATVAAMKKLVVTGTTGAQTVIIDFLGGMWGVGTANGVGIDVDLGGGGAAVAGDALKIRGTKTADKIVFGANGITTNADMFKDITYANVAAFAVTLGEGDDSFSGAGSAVVGGPFTRGLAVYGSGGNDTLQGGNGNDTLDGGDGNDTLVAAGAIDGADILIGGPGSDTADYSARTAGVVLYINGMPYSGDASGTEGDTINTDIETIKGGSGYDELFGSPNADTIYGGPGDDLIEGEGGDDILNGDAGDDVFVFDTHGSDGADVVNGGAGIDTVNYRSRSAPVTVNLDGTATSGEAGEHDKIAADVENVVGGDGDDTINGSAANNSLDGGPGNDTIHGGAGNDILQGGLGHNTLYGDAGDDVFDQELVFDPQAQLHFNFGSDVIFGGAGSDTVDYSGRFVALNVVMDGTTPGGELGEADVIGTDVENLIGGNASDHLTGNAADNVIEGGASNDTIAGLGGEDTIDGGGEADIIDCGTGDADVLVSRLAVGGTATSCEE